MGTQGCANYRANFLVDGLCRGCNSLDRNPIPVFGSDDTQLDEEFSRVLSQMMPHDSKEQPVGARRLQQEEPPCICDPVALGRQSAPSVKAVS
eukprot:CAMPEP_0176171556 /NCGR_PEP_ID=MMETSP0120_2-20121206/87835_1 /TAXON_ID=160619 /ORGANISM="Kryptoperidinium foliaceum, Strain CCMP 1326" /LENGTH=92 /DNA_ID=CAMNT_0017509403 /DNA_START=1 /DNA_END=275 /DNA_ORIENTATION=-